MPAPDDGSEPPIESKFTISICIVY
jgi:hypothetical protein